MTEAERGAATPRDLAAEYFAWHARGEFRLQRCGRCGSWTHPPTEDCAACGSVEMAWEPACGDGTLYTWTVTHQPYTPLLAQLVPHVLAVVQCAEGPRVLTTLVDIGTAELSPGLALSVRFEIIGDGPLRAVFAPVVGR